MICVVCLLVLELMSHPIWIRGLISSVVMQMCLFWLLMLNPLLCRRYISEVFEENMMIFCMACPTSPKLVFYFILMFYKSSNSKYV